MHIQSVNSFVADTSFVLLKVNKYQPDQGNTFNNKYESTIFF